jgi:hypothetical protein
MLQSISRNFPGIFGIFWVFFVPLNIFWAFPRFVFALKNISKKNLPYRIGPSQKPDPTRSAHTGPTRQPAEAHLANTPVPPLPGLWPRRARFERLGPRGYKGRVP